MTILLDQSGYQVVRNRRVGGGSFVVPGFPAVPSVTRNRVVSNGGAVTSGVVQSDALTPSAIVRDRVFGNSVLSFTSGDYEPGDSGGGAGNNDTGGSGDYTWRIDEYGNARVKTVQLGSPPSTWDVMLERAGANKLGLASGDTFQLGAGTHLSPDFIDIPELPSSYVSDPYRRQAGDPITGTGTGTTPTLASDYLAGSTVIVVVVTMTDVTHTTPSGWSVAYAPGYQSNRKKVTVFYKYMSSGGTLSQAFTVGSSEYVMYAIEVVGILDTSPVDVTANANGTSSSQTVNVGSGTTGTQAAAKNYSLAVMVLWGAGGGWAGCDWVGNPANGYEFIWGGNGTRITDYGTVASLDKVLPDTSAQVTSADFHLISTVSTTYGGVVVTFKGATGQDLTPPSNFARIIARDNAGDSQLAYISDSGDEYPLGGGAVPDIWIPAEELHPYASANQTGSGVSDTPVWSRWENGVDNAYAMATFLVPPDVPDATTPQAYVYWTPMTTATTGGIRWRIYAKVIGEASQLTATGTECPVTEASESRSNYYLYISPAISLVSVNPGDLVRMNINRYSAHTDDTYTGACYGVGIRVTF